MSWTCILHCMYCSFCSSYSHQMNSCWYPCRVRDQHFDFRINNKITFYFVSVVKLIRRYSLRFSKQIVTFKSVTGQFESIWISRNILTKAIWVFRCDPQTYNRPRQRWKINYVKFCFNLQLCSILDIPRHTSRHTWRMYGKSFEPIMCVALLKNSNRVQTL